MVGGVLDPDNGWDIRKSLVEKVLKMFPGAEPIIPKVTIDDHFVLQDFQNQRTTGYLNKSHVYCKT